MSPVVRRLATDECSLGTPEQIPRRAKRVTESAGLPLPRSFGELDAPKSAPARKAALLRPFGGTHFSGSEISCFDGHR
jgi:hypothetical protein